MSKKVTLKQIRYFVSAAQTGRFSQAALQEHVSQSAITSAVLDLEQQLGVSLFDRLQHGVALTEAGRLFYRHAVFILDSVAEAMSMPLSEAILGSEGKIVVAASYTMLGYFLPELIARFKRANPNVTIDLLDLSLVEMEEALAKGTIDMAIGSISNLPSRKPYHTQVLMRSPRRLWVSPTHPLGNRDSVSLEEVANCPYLILTIDGAVEFTNKFWENIPTKPDYVLQTSSLESVRGFVGQGLGVTILSDMVYRPWSLDGKKINAVRIEDGVPDLEGGIFWLKTRPLTKVADTFQRFLIYASTS
ncbi:LysR family transcriptional regulator [Pelistega suis]|uniref:LysR family transcriptional regulator n=1 Tax=Pelistega suis TaxID=1631957 RepID=A0A849P494_9BURK|nr:LysR family transcriptional regulator [Pelistega suis]NOL52380.1 LysR family transcriptional regulator [Pelistega suis]